MFVLGLMTASQFQPTNVVGGSTTKTKKITMQSIPKQKASWRNRTGRKFHRQWSVPGAADVFAKLFLVRCENANAPPPA
jgi:hypothetical protein